MLEVRRLRLLRELARHGTIAATAQALSLTAPGISQQLALLEREAGAPLLEKRGRTLELTPVGRLLVSHADIILGDLAAAESALAAMAANGPGIVRLAAFPSAARRLVAPMWSGVPGVSLRLTEQEPECALTSLLRQDVDIAIVHSYSLLPRNTPARCEEHPVAEDPVLLAVPPALAERRALDPGAPVQLAEFRDQPWLTPGRDLSCREMALRACGAAGFVPEVVAEAADFSVLVALVAAGAGVALVPAMALPEPSPAIGLHPLTEPVTRRVTALSLAGGSRRPDIRAVLTALGQTVSVTRGIEKKE